MHDRTDFFDFAEARQRALAFSQAVRVGNLVEISGTVGIGTDLAPVSAGDTRAQMERIYERFGEALAHFGLDFSHAVKEVIYALDMQALKDAMPIRNSIYGEGPYPACTAVEVSALFSPGIVVEIEMTAVIPGV